ncbi:hypothetical protein [Streptacidiphilus sp. EB129]|uniref:hypothetical protein n=1 Tax=Streptacidiphilus sp. EB129 TaxID=3156262 RepID=UPI003510D780
MVAVSDAREGYEDPAGAARGHRRERGGSRGGGSVGVTYKYFGAPDRATAARVPTALGRDGLGLDAGELGTLGRLGELFGQDGLEGTTDEPISGGLSTKIKPETMSAMVLTGIQGIPRAAVPPLELVVLHPDYAVFQLPHTVVEPLRKADEAELGTAAFIWSTVPDRGGPRDAFVIYQMLHEWQDFANRLHDAGHQLYCLMWP